MNKKLLICGAIAAALLITACVKKEEPKQEEQEQVETAPSEAMPAEPAQFETLDATDTQEIEPTPSRTEIIREETPNTTTEVRREVQTPVTAPVEAPKPTVTPKAEAPKTESKPAPVTPKQNSGSAQSEDDAVAAAIAAATPALGNKCINFPKKSPVQSTGLFLITMYFYKVVLSVDLSKRLKIWF